MAVKGAAEIQAETEKAAVRSLRSQAVDLSWKDEMWSVVLAFPIGMAFLPWTSEWARKGFIIMATVPWWYQGLACIALCYAYHRKVVSLFGLVRGVGK